MSLINPERFQVLNWNVQKQHSVSFRQELEQLTLGADLTTLQEAVLEPEFLNSLGSDNSLSYTPGYRSRLHQTGVLTLSRMPPLSSSQHLKQEPWLRSQKAIQITQHQLDGHDQALLLINLHAINFTLGDSAYQAQLQSILPALDTHRGPAILTGDFNCWNPARRRRLKSFTDQCRLTEVPFDEDHRKRVVRHPLDHIFARDLEILSASTQKTKASDHNPLIVNFTCK